MWGIHPGGSLDSDSGPACKLKLNIIAKLDSWAGAGSWSQKVQSAEGTSLLALTSHLLSISPNKLSGPEPIGDL